MLYSLENLKPQVHPSCFVAESAEVIGRVHLEKGVSVWFQAVLRGDNDAIHIGEDSNIQDGVIIHVDPGFECRVGKGTVVGHRAGEGRDRQERRGISRSSRVVRSRPSALRRYL